MASYDQRSLAFFAADFPPDFGRRLPAAAETIKKNYQPDDVSFHPGSSYLFKWWGARKLMILNNTRFACQTLGLDKWREGIAEFSAATADALKSVEACTLKRVGFKIIAFLSQSMAHQEIGDLFFGSFLASSEELKSICESPNDPFIQINGERSGMKLVLCLTAVNPDQIGQLLLSPTNNLDGFARRSAVTDPAITGIVQHLMAGPALMVDLDLFTEDSPVDGVGEFQRRALKAAEAILESSHAKLIARVAE